MNEVELLASILDKQEREQNRYESLLDKALDKGIRAKYESGALLSEAEKKYLAQEAQKGENNLKQALSNMSEAGQLAGRLQQQQSMADQKRAQLINEALQQNEQYEDLASTDIYHLLTKQGKAPTLNELQKEAQKRGYNIISGAELNKQIGQNAFDPNRLYVRKGTLAQVGETQRTKLRTDAENARTAALRADTALKNRQLSLQLKQFVDPIQGKTYSIFNDDVELMKMKSPTELYKMGRKDLADIKTGLLTGAHITEDPYYTQNSKAYYENYDRIKRDRGTVVGTGEDGAPIYQKGLTGNEQDIVNEFLRENPDFDEETARGKNLLQIALANSTINKDMAKALTPKTSGRLEALSDAARKYDQRSFWGRLYDITLGNGLKGNALSAANNAAVISSLAAPWTGLIGPAAVAATYDPGVGDALQYLLDPGNTEYRKRLGQEIDETRAYYSPDYELASRSEYTEHPDTGIQGYYTEGYGYNPTYRGRGFDERAYNAAIDEAIRRHTNRIEPMISERSENRYRKSDEELPFANF